MKFKDACLQLWIYPPARVAFIVTELIVSASNVVCLALIYSVLNPLGSFIILDYPMSEKF